MYTQIEDLRTIEVHQVLHLNLHISGIDAVRQVPGDAADEQCLRFVKSESEFTESVVDQMCKSLAFQRKEGEVPLVRTDENIDLHVSWDSSVCIESTFLEY